MQPAVRWTGSKRNVSKELHKLVPKYNRYFEPFLGGGSLSFYQHDIHGSDVLVPLIEIWKLIRDEPESLLRSYTTRWEALQNDGESYYYEVRERFNKGGDPHDFYFLTRTSFNGLIRFNRRGCFNASFSWTRRGATPDWLSNVLLSWHSKIVGAKYNVQSYEKIDVVQGDFVFCDPPYLGKSSTYSAQEFSYENLFSWLEWLNKKSIAWMLTLRQEIPTNLYATRLGTSGGNSTYINAQPTVKRRTVNEWVYTNYKVGNAG